MATLMLTCVLHCCTLVLAPDRKWTDQDKGALSSAQQHCRDEGKCLVKLKKVEEGLYTATCGKENN